MKKMILALLLALAPMAQAIEIGKTVPDFSAQTSEGKTVKISDYKGKTVVLEWLNYGCPFVKKQYGSKNMQELQAKYTARGVVWLSVISSAPGKQGHSTPKQAQEDRKKNGSAATAVILDEKGTLGKLYGAETTPHMFVINSIGTLIYQGAIDDKASTDIADVKGAKNYVAEALEYTLSTVPPKKPLAVSQTKSYGCAVKYN